MVATVRAQVMLSLFTDFEKFSTFKPDPRHEREINAMLDQIISWARRSRPSVPQRTGDDIRHKATSS